MIPASAMTSTMLQCCCPSGVCEQFPGCKKNRNYDIEAAHLPKHDFDVRMHEFLWRTFVAKMVSGNALELGCFQGAWTARLFKECLDVTVVEASADCLAATKARWPLVEFIHSTFEVVDLGGRTFDNIFLMHTLEHLDEPVKVLKRCREWLAPSGLLFVAVPNAYALSRQIAVRMGLLPDEKAVTAAEAAHGHKRTYCQVELTMHLSEAGLVPVEQGGVMLKPMANWQWDRALDEGIVDAAYLEACYELGKKHPAMCASLYAVCEAP